ncbi:MAG: cytochrome d ubiquinol oxidase subunit, partial [Arthrobacter sp.]|nr:cytochrome d ubiquinol oxidase subunit [Arthrobacter sp.]
MAGWAVSVQILFGKTWTLALLAAAMLAAAAAWIQARKGKEGTAFLATGIFLVGGTASIFGAVFPRVLPSTIDPAFSLTITNASSSDYTLGLMTVVACVGLPLVIAYQAWTYWVFRRRVS